MKEMVGSARGATVLDVATGSADIPRALLVWGRRSGKALDITGCDISREVLEEARVYATGTDIRLCEADARNLPWSDNAFDVVLCCLALHHFNADEARDVLREMWRVARSGIVVTDLYRSYPAYVGTWMATHVGARSRVTWHDGPLSVLRAYTPAELKQVAVKSGIESAVVRRHAFFRQTLLARKGSPAHG
jgi:ubiquinone/menaquinone biosynthesis C-methylase UbiE